MYLVAQFGKSLSELYFLGAHTFDVKIGQKRHSRVARVFDGLVYFYMLEFSRRVLQELQ